MLIHILYIYARTNVAHTHYPSNLTIDRLFGQTIILKKAWVSCKSFAWHVRACIHKYSFIYLHFIDPLTLV